MTIPETAGFVLERSQGQPWLQLPHPGADIRFFLKGTLLEETRGNAANSRVALEPLLGPPLPLSAPKQVHGIAVLDSASTENLLPSVVEADGILLDTYGVEASLRFADCAPVVVASSGSPAWVLMMHSGYKGTVQNIVEAGLEKVRARYGVAALHSARAWIGPCIGRANYPRDGDEWTLRGLETFHGQNIKGAGEKFFFDIAGELRLQLLEEGIDEERILLSGMDTFACPSLCYSYRGGEREKRMFLWAALKA